MNTAEAVVLSQIPIMILGTMLWMEIRIIRKALLNNSTKKIGANLAAKNLVKKSTKEPT